MRTGTTSPTEAVASGAVALVVERALDSTRSSARRRGCAGGDGGRCRCLLRPPEHPPHVAGVTGTNGKTTATVLLRSILEAAELSHRPHRHGRLDRRRGAPRRRAHDPRVDRAPASARRDGRCRRRSGRDRGVVARLTLPAARPDRLLRTRVHEPLARITSTSTATWSPTSWRSGDSSPALTPPPAAVNIGDPYGRRLADELAAAGRAPLITFGLRPEAEVRADDARADAARAHGSPPLGSPSRRRCSASSTSRTSSPRSRRRLLLDVDDDAIAAGVAAVAGVSGRFEAVDEGQDFAVIVDYAHTPARARHGARRRRASSATGG